jgi:S1-C subfamily serine protease
MFMCCKRVTGAFLICGAAMVCAPLHDATASTPGAIYERASASVVLIKTYDGSGTGFVVSSDGRVVTNYHVIRSTKRASIALENGDIFDDVQVLDVDKRKDIALLKIKAVDLKPLTLGNSSAVQIGDTVYSVSNPLGTYENSLSQGIISGIRPDDGYHTLQITAPISHGSSGGPLFNSQAEVIGITSASDGNGQNLNFAVPTDYVRGMLASQTQPKPLATAYDPVQQPTSTNYPQTPTQRAKSAARAIVMLLTLWISARIGRRVWNANNTPAAGQTIAWVVWVKLAAPVLFCVGAAVLMILVDVVLGPQ